MSDFKDAFEAGLGFDRVFNVEGGPIVVLKEGEQAVPVADLIDKLQPAPRRKTGHPSFLTADSFAAYVTAHKAAGTVLFGDRDRASVVAVIDHHSTETPGWKEHRATLKLELERRWVDWTKLDRQLAGQEKFVEFLEDHKADIASPDAAELIEVCTALRGKKGVEWASGIDLQTGAIQLSYQETLEATSARKGTIEVPARLALGLKVYRGQAAYRVDARLRWRITEGKLGFIVVLDSPDDVLDAAFADVVEGIGKATELPVLFGAP